MIWFAATLALAGQLELPGGLAPQVLSETLPGAWPPFPMDVDDWGFDWEGAPIDGVHVTLSPGSVEWVRVSDVLVLPRARLIVDVDSGSGGTVAVSGYTQPLAPTKDGHLQGELPIALSSNSIDAIRLQVAAGGKDLEGAMVLRFAPKKPGLKIGYDTSCSPEQVTIDASGLDARTADTSWMYLGCRYVLARNHGHAESSLEVLTVWDGIDQSLTIGGSPVPSGPEDVWPLRLASAPGHTTLGLGGSSVSLSWKVPAVAHLGRFGVTLGPMLWVRSISRDTTVVSSDSAFLLSPTFYATYALSEKARVVLGDTFSPRWGEFSNDFGAYYSTEAAQLLDTRVSFNTLLGAHMSVFQAQGKVWVRVGFPQGADFVIHDVGRRGLDAQLGGFLFPLVGNKFYANAFVSYGTARWFGQASLVSWEEPLKTNYVNESSLTFSVGTTLFRCF